MDDFTQIHQMLDRQAEARPDAIAVIDSDGRAVTWAEYAALVRSKADQMTEAGIVAGHRVMIVAENCLEVAVVLMACSRIGAIAVPVNARMSAVELARIQAHADPKLVLYTIGASKEAAAHADAAGPSFAAVTRFTGSASRRARQSRWRVRRCCSTPPAPPAIPRASC